MTRKLCSVEGCEKPHFGRGWCTTHYGRWRRTGDPLGMSAPSVVAVSTATCRVDGCTRKMQGHGFCGMHLQRMRRTGSPTSPTRAQKPKIIGRATCWFPECGDHQDADGLCGPHRLDHSLHDDVRGRTPLAQASCRACDHPHASEIDRLLDDGCPATVVGRIFLLSPTTVGRHSTHRNDPEWHAKRAAWWIGELAALTGPVDNPPAKVHEVSEGEPEAWSE